MRIDILTLFPEMFVGPLDQSIVKRARERGLLAVHLHNIRGQAQGKHQTADDYPYGGGPGMVLKPEPIFSLVASLREEPTHVILLTPQGQLLTQSVLVELARRPHLLLICAHYEGVDERVRAHVVDREVSIGDYVLTGGEIPAMVLVDGVARLLPGVLGSSESQGEESFAEGLLEYPQFTRPEEFQGHRVPQELLSGDHKKVAAWRRRQRLLRTLQRRPDLLTPEAWEEIRGILFQEPPL